LKNLVSEQKSNAFPLLSMLTRPAASANAQQVGGQDPFGGFISGIFNQALSNIARPAGTPVAAGTDLLTTGTNTKELQTTVISTNSLLQLTNPKSSLSNIPGWCLALLNLLIYGDGIKRD